MIWEPLKSLINGHSTFLISSHLSLDGDSVGSQLAFSWYLESLGKKAVVFNQDPVPGKFLFLRGAQTIVNSMPSGNVDTLVVLDCSNKLRLGWDTTPFDGLPAINIDHHRDNTRFGAVNIVETKAAATGEILYRFFTGNGIVVPPEVAEALYLAIMTDTGGFRFPNTTAGVLEICADLARLGADPSSIYERVYASHSRAGLLLHSRIWSSLRYYLDGKVCCMELPMTLYNELGAVHSDSEGMADYTISAANVEVGMLVKYSDRETHFSLRSKKNVDVGAIAARIKGGGGHSSAAGCTIGAPFPEALDQMLSIIRQELG